MPKTATATLEYAGKQYTVSETFQYGDDDDIEFMWYEGNWSCDCNRSNLIRLQVDPDFPDMRCGDTIKLVNLSIS